MPEAWRKEYPSPARRIDIQRSARPSPRVLEPTQAPARTVAPALPEGSQGPNTNESSRQPNRVTTKRYERFLDSQNKLHKPPTHISSGRDGATYEYLSHTWYTSHLAVNTTHKNTSVCHQTQVYRAYPHLQTTEVPSSPVTFCSPWTPGSRLALPTRIHLHALHPCFHCLWKGEDALPAHQHQRR